MNKLRDRNKTINTQIELFVKVAACASLKDLNCLETQSEPSDHNMCELNIPLTKKLSSKPTFTIKRKSSAHFDSSSGNEKHSDSERAHLSTTTRTFHPTRKRNSANSRPLDKSQQKCYVVQQPKVFEDDVIPQVPLTYTTPHRFNPTRTSRPKDKKSDNLRLKRLNNPAPVDNPLLHDAFCYQL